MNKKLKELYVRKFKDLVYDVFCFCVAIAEQK